MEIYLYNIMLCYRCEIAVNALALEENKFYHPSKEKWEQVPDRPSAWRLKPDSYIWVPSTQLFKNNSSRPFPKQFVVFITLRLVNVSILYITSKHGAKYHIRQFVASI